MTLLHAEDLALAFESRQIFKNVTFTLEEGERVGLVGVNGSGKSSLMKMLAGGWTPDKGIIQRRKGCSLMYLPQEPTFPEDATISSELMVASAPLREAIEEHGQLADRFAAAPEASHEKMLNRMSVLSERIDQLGGWDTEYQAKTLLHQLGVDDWDRPISELSGGLKKRVALARALLTRPDLLLLDEPTNHLDADTVDWLEEAIDALPSALLLVTHDRYFLDDLVDRIIEIQPGAGIVSYPGNYHAYLEAKLLAEEAAAVGQHKRDRWISQEVAWLRKGVEARRTKSKSRIARANALMAERKHAAPKVAEFKIATAPRLSQTVLEAKAVGKRYDQRTVLSNVDCLVQQGDRLGLVGPNGVGKTTFLKVLLGEVPPDEGKVIVGQRTRVAYYDQQRDQLDPEQTVFEAAWGEEYVELDGKRVALRDYLNDLLFPVPMQRMQVKTLSGGERNRLLLARLFLQGANVLVLDEPTNDLDIVTLNVLEGLLLQFSGAVLLVTHDRYFLDKTATSILSFEGNGKVVRYPGNYEMYRRLRKTPLAGGIKPDSKKASAFAIAASSSPKPSRLTLGERGELEKIAVNLQRAEAQKAKVEAELNSPETYRDRLSPRIHQLQADLKTATSEVEKLYERWAQLESKV